MLLQVQLPTLLSTVVTTAAVEQVLRTADTVPGNPTGVLQTRSDWVGTGAGTISVRVGGTVPRASLTLSKIVLRIALA